MAEPNWDWEHVNDVFRVKYLGRYTADREREFFDVTSTRYDDGERLARLLNQRETLLDIVEDAVNLLTGGLMEHVTQNYELEVTYQITENGGDWEDPDVIPDDPDCAESVRTYTEDFNRLGELRQAMADLVERIKDVQR